MKTSSILLLLCVFLFAFSCDNNKQPEGTLAVTIQPSFVKVAEHPSEREKNWDMVNMFTYDHKPDVYFEVILGEESVYKSPIVKDSFKPTWKKAETFYIPRDKENAKFRIKFSDHDKKLGVKTGRFYNEDDLIGEIVLTLDQMRKKARSFDTLRFGKVKACLFADPIYK